MPMLEQPVSDQGIPFGSSDFAALVTASADLLDPACWREGLEKFARATNLAVAMTDAEGRLLGDYINPQTTWSLLHSTVSEGRPPPDATDCPMSLAPYQSCTCVTDALASGSYRMVHGRSGLVHFAVPLMLGEHHLGALVAGQVFDRYPEQLPLERVARQIGISPIKIWELARLEHPVKQTTLQVYADLLVNLGQTFLLTRFHTFKEAERLAEMTRLRDRAEAATAERQHADAARQETEERYRALVDQATVGIAHVDLQGCFLLVNQRFCDIVGYSREELCGLRQQDITHPDEQAPNDEPFEQNMHAQVGYVVEKRYLHKDGSEIWVQNSISILRDAAGQPQSLSAVVIDITDRKRADEALAERGRLVALRADLGAVLGRGDNVRHCLQQCTETLVQHLHAAFARIWTLNEADNVLELQASAGLYTHLDGPHSRVKMGEFKIGRIAQIGQPHLTNAIVDDPQVSDQEWARREGLVAFAGYPLLVEERVVGVLAVFARQPLAESVLHELAPIADAIAQWLRRMGAEAALIEADKRKDEFLAMLAHELRNPLAPILSAVQTMRLRGSDDPLAEWARDVVERQVRKMTRLVDELLDVSRISTGKVTLRKEVVDLALLVTRTVEGARPQLEQRGHELTVALPPDAVYLDADPTRLEQVLGNLLNNAAKYTEEKGHIWLTVEREAARFNPEPILAGEVVGDNKECVLIRVRDDGMGIPVEMLPRVFDLFTQLDRSLAHSQGGLGIGLTLVHRMVEMHGGSVQAFSAGPGQGSEFVVRLPVLPKTSPQEKVSNKATVPSLPASARRILVVDDNVDAAEALALVLRMSGHVVQTAHTGQAGLEAALAALPDVVLLDIGLPDMDGYEVAQRLSQETTLDQTRLVALTGYGQAEDMRRSHDAGFFAHLVKPVDIDALSELLNQPELVGHGPR